MNERRDREIDAMLADEQKARREALEYCKRAGEFSLERARDRRLPPPGPPCERRNPQALSPWEIALIGVGALVFCIVMLVRM